MTDARYFLDTEFNGFGGELLSLALVGDGDECLYLVVPHPKEELVEWVAENVWPIRHHPCAVTLPVQEWGREIQRFLGDQPAIVVSDWPDDIKYFCEVLITGPGEMVSVDNLTFGMVRVDAYPTDVPGAIRHNALWDALALRDKFK